MRADENEQLTRTGPGTPMGELMRQYWLPVAASTEFEAGGVPVRLRILGEDFLGFRSPDGKVGIIDHQCAHRCASLFYGRNEEGGIRCVYHGWKFDTSGQCVEMPSEPPETDYKEGVKLRAAQVRERFGVVWAYLGSRETPPALPQFDMEDFTDDQIQLSFLYRECNWLQALEGDIDTCHVGFLHLGGIGPEHFEEGSINYYRQMPENLAPRYEALETDYGTMYCATRPAGENMYHRVGQFAMPFWTAAPAEELTAVRWRAWLPIDDENSMLVVIGGPGIPVVTKDKHGNPVAGGGIGMTMLPNTTDWYGRWRIANNPRNDHLIDRGMQRDKNYTGIAGIPIQDQAITESMGPIVDRTKEHLGTSDRMIMLTRRKLMRQSSALAEQGTAPTGVENPAVFRYSRSGFVLAPKDRDWLDEYNQHRSEWSGGACTPIQRLGNARSMEPA